MVALRSSPVHTEWSTSFSCRVHSGQIPGVYQRSSLDESKEQETREEQDTKEELDTREELDTSKEQETREELDKGKEQETRGELDTREELLNEQSTPVAQQWIDHNTTHYHNTN